MKNFSFTFVILGSFFSIFITSLIFLVIVTKARRSFFQFESDRIVLPSLNESQFFSLSKKTSTDVKISLKKNKNGNYVSLEGYDSFLWPSQKKSFLEAMHERTFAAQNYALLTLRKRDNIGAITIWSEEKFPASTFLEIASELVKFGFSRLDMVVTAQADYVAQQKQVRLHNE